MASSSINDGAVCATGLHVCACVFLKLKNIGLILIFHKSAKKIMQRGTRKTVSNQQIGKKGISQSSCMDAMMLRQHGCCTPTSHVSYLPLLPSLSLL